MHGFCFLTVGLRQGWYRCLFHIYCAGVIDSFSTLMFHITSHFDPVFLSSKFRLKGKELVCEFLGKKEKKGEGDDVA